MVHAEQKRRYYLSRTPRLRQPHLQVSIFPPLVPLGIDEIARKRVHLRALHTITVITPNRHHLQTISAQPSRLVALLQTLSALRPALTWFPQPIVPSFPAAPDT